MIDESFAREQVARLSGLDQFPKASAAIKELMLALQAAKTKAIAEQVISTVLEVSTSDNPRCPLPADIRRLVWERNEAEGTKPRCPRCGGTGWGIVYELITYAGKSLHVHKKERLPDIHNDEEAFALQRQIDAAGVENQIVLSAARRCGCL